MEIVPTSLLGVLPDGAKVGVADSLSVKYEHYPDVAICKGNTQRYGFLEGLDGVSGLADCLQQFGKAFRRDALRYPFQHPSLRTKLIVNRPAGKACFLRDVVQANVMVAALDYQRCCRVEDACARGFCAPWSSPGLSALRF